jgi:iron(III) transport system substrate-binding protein
MRKVLFVTIGVLLAAGLVFGAGKKVLHMYTSFDVEEAEYYISAFEASHPDIDVQYVRLSSGQALARIRAEADNPQASIWYAGSATSHIAAAADGLLAPYTESAAWQAVPDQFKDPNGYWVGIYLGYIGFVTNTEFLKKHGIEAPTSWFDLLDPVFKKEIAKAYPFTSGTAYTTLIGQLTALGSSKPGFDVCDIAYLKAFHEQIHHYTESGTACITQAGQGEVAVGIAFSHDIIRKGIAKGYPVVMTFPVEGTGYEIGGMSLIKGGPEPELAKIFYDWALSKEAQDLFAKAYRVPINPEATVCDACVTADQVKVVPIDFVWYGQHKDEIIDQWREITGE